MLIERTLENDLVNILKTLPELSVAQVVGSRTIPEDEYDTKTEEADKASVIAVVCGFRSQDAFSLSLITINASVTILTRVEMDPSSELHDKIVEAIANKLSYWHKFGNIMTNELSSEKFFAGELRMDGGTGRIVDKTNRLWTETIQFSIRGSEKFA